MKNILLWIFGVLFLLAGLANLSQSFVPGLFMALAGLILIPSTFELLKKRTGKNLNWKHRLGLFILFFLVGAFIGSATSEQAVSNLSSNSSADSEVPMEDTIDSTETDVTAIPEETIEPELSPEETLESALRDTVEVTEYELADGVLTVTFKGSDNLTKNMIRRGIYIDIKDGLEIVAQNAPDYLGGVTFEAWLPLDDPYGKTSNQVVVEASFLRTSWMQVNWENFLTDNIPVIADEFYEHPALY